MLEIGSEFPWVSCAGKAQPAPTLPAWLSPDGKSIPLISGESALNLVLDDIRQKHPGARSVYMPSYCCESMLRPFARHGISVRFYTVSPRPPFFEVPEHADCDIFYALHYFGYRQGRMDEWIARFQRQGKIVIEDCTHSLLGPSSGSHAGDYRIASIRKWFPLLTGGYAWKADGPFSPGLLNNIAPPPTPFLAGKKRAMQDKAEYLQNGDSSLKPLFLQAFAQSNEELESLSNRLFFMDSLSLRILNDMDVETIIRQRRQNAVLLHRRLQGERDIRPWFVLSAEDCPLFVPVLLKDTVTRESLRRHLIEKSIFCPVHWPYYEADGIPKRNKAMYERELSLVCDQRYGANEMKTISEEIACWKSSR